MSLLIILLENSILCVYTADVSDRVLTVVNKTFDLFSCWWADVNIRPAMMLFGGNICAFFLSDDDLQGNMVRESFIIVVLTYTLYVKDTV